LCIFQLSPLTVFLESLFGWLDCVKGKVEKDIADIGRCSKMEVRPKRALLEKLTIEFSIIWRVFFCKK